MPVSWLVLCLHMEADLSIWKKLLFLYNFHWSFTRHRIVFVATLEFNASLEVAIDSATGKRQRLAIGNVLAMSRLTSVIERNRYFHKQQVSHYFNWTMLYNLQRKKRTDNPLLLDCYEVFHCKINYFTFYSDYKRKYFYRVTFTSSSAVLYKSRSWFLILFLYFHVNSEIEIIFTKLYFVFSR